MQSPAPTANPVFVDDEGAIAQNLECIGCGYNLRGLLVDAQCPECGEAVRDSFAGHGFLRANASWLRRMAAGLLVLMLSMIVSIFLFLLSWPGVLAGCLLFTTPTEQVLRHEACNRKRVMARGIVVASTGVLAFSILVLFLSGRYGLPLAWMMWLAAIFCSWIAMYRYATEIARRFAEPGLMKSSRRMTGVSAIVLGMVPLGSAGFWLTSTFDLDIGPLFVLLAIMLVVGAFGAFVVLIMTLGLVETFRSQMMRAAEQFDWQRPPPADAPAAPAAPVAAVEPIDRATESA